GWVRGAERGGAGGGEARRGAGGGRPALRHARAPARRGPDPAPRRAVGAAGAPDRRPRLCAADGPHRPRRPCDPARERRAGAAYLPRRHRRITGAVAVVFLSFPRKRESRDNRWLTSATSAFVCVVRVL